MSGWLRRSRVAADRPATLFVAPPRERPRRTAHADNTHDTAVEPQHCIARLFALFLLCAAGSSMSFVVSTHVAPLFFAARAVGSSAMRTERLYLSYKNAPCNGLNHQIANLREMLADAAELGRVAVVDPPCLITKHNKQLRGKKWRGVKKAWAWSDYVDLDLATAVTAKGDMVPVHYILARDYAQLPSERSKLRTSWRTPASTGPDAALHGILIRNMDGVPGGIFRNRASAEERTKLEVAIPPARDAVIFAEQMARAIGERDTIIAVHVRRGDRLRQVSVARVTARRVRRSRSLSPSPSLPLSLSLSLSAPTSLRSPGSHPRLTPHAPAQNYAHAPRRKRMHSVGTNPAASAAPRVHPSRRTLARQTWGVW
jgi:hypothetical protein